MVLSRPWSPPSILNHSGSRREITLAVHSVVQLQDEHLICDAGSIAHDTREHVLREGEMGAPPLPCASHRGWQLASHPLSPN